MQFLALSIFDSQILQHNDIMKVPKYCAVLHYAKTQNFNVAECKN